MPQLINEIAHPTLIEARVMIYRDRESGDYYYQIVQRDSNDKDYILAQDEGFSSCQDAQDAACRDVIGI